MPTEPTSLTPDERALAERLARMGPHAEPSPALDARVLAAARASVAVPPRGRPRWPAVFGLAASLLLAVGIAWHLRPLPDTRPASTYRASIPPRPSAAPAQTRAEKAIAPQGIAPAAAVVEEPNARPEPQASIGQPAAAEAMATEPSPPLPAAHAKSLRNAEAAADAQAVFDTVPAMQAPTAAPPAPPPDDRPRAFSDSAAPPAPVEAPEAASSTAGNEAARAASAAGDEPDLDVPPATADSPAVRDAWLQRIQTLVEAGDIEGARASLRAFVARYPAYTLPENLRALSR